MESDALLLTSRIGSDSLFHTHEPSSPICKMSLRSLSSQAGKENSEDAGSPRGRVVIRFWVAEVCFHLSSPSSMASPSPATDLLLLGTSVPKFSWQESQKRLPLIGCVLLLIALVISLIILCEFEQKDGDGFWSLLGGTRHGVCSRNRMGDPMLGSQRDPPAHGLGSWSFQAPWRWLGEGCRHHSSLGSSLLLTRVN